MPVSGVILEVEPGREQRLADELKGVRHLNVSGAERGCVIVVTDTERLEEDCALVESLGRYPGVHSASVVFTNLEDV